MQSQGPVRKKEKADEQSLFSKGSAAFQNVFGGKKNISEKYDKDAAAAKRSVWKSASLNNNSKVSPQSSAGGKVLWKSANAPKRGAHSHQASLRGLGKRELELKRLELRPLLNALRFVESSNRVNVPDGDEGQSIGPFQISLDYHQDVWQRRHSWEKARNIDHAEETVIKYWSIYCPKALETQDYETLAKIHNGGPQGPSAAKTTYYWSKVLRHLKQQQELHIPPDAQHLSPLKAGGAKTKWKDAPKRGDRSGRGKHPVQPLRLLITSKGPILIKEHRHSLKAQRPKLVAIKAHHVYRPSTAAKDKTGSKRVARAAQKAPVHKRPAVHSRCSSFSSTTTYGQYTQASSSAALGGGFPITEVQTPGKARAGTSQPRSSSTSPKTPKPSAEDLSIQPCDSISQRPSPENSFVTNSPEDVPLFRRTPEEECAGAKSASPDLHQRGALRLGFRVSSRSRLSPGKRRRHPFRSSIESDPEHLDRSRPVRSVRLGISIEELQQALQAEALAHRKLTPATFTNRDSIEDDLDSSGLSECEVASPVSSAGSLSPNKAFSLAFLQTAIRKTQKQMAALMIERAYLKHRPRRAFVRIRDTTVRLQRRVRAWQAGKPVRARFLSLRRSIVTFQRLWRTKHERESTLLQAVQERILFLTMQKAAVEIQRVWRGVLARKRISAEHRSSEEEATPGTAGESVKGRNCESKVGAFGLLSPKDSEGARGPAGSNKSGTQSRPTSRVLEDKIEDIREGQSLAALSVASLPKRIERFVQRPELDTCQKLHGTSLGRASSDKLPEGCEREAGETGLAAQASPLLSPRREQTLYEQLAELLPSCESLSLDTAEAANVFEPVCVGGRENLALSLEALPTKTVVTATESEEWEESLGNRLGREEVGSVQGGSEGSLSPGRESELLAQLAELLGQSQLESAHMRVPSEDPPLLAETEVFAADELRSSLWALQNAALASFEEERVASWHARKPLDLLDTGLQADSYQAEEDFAGSVARRSEARPYKAHLCLDAEPLLEKSREQEEAWVGAPEESILLKGHSLEHEKLAPAGDLCSGECTPERYPHSESDGSVFALQKSETDVHRTPVASPALVFAEAALLDSASKVACWNDAAANEPPSDQNLSVSIASPGNAAWENDNFDLSWQNGFPDDSWTDSPSHHSLCTRQSHENESSLGEIKVSDCPSPDKSLGLVRAEVEKFNSLQKSPFTQGSEACGHLGIKPLDHVEWGLTRQGLGVLKQWLVETETPPGKLAKHKDREPPRMLETGFASDSDQLRVSLTKSRSQPNLETLYAHNEQESPSRSPPKRQKLSPLPLGCAANNTELSIPSPLPEARSNYESPSKESSLLWDAGLSTPPLRELPDPEPSDSPEELKSPERGATFDSFATPPLQRAHTAPNPRGLYAHAAHRKGETECLVCRLWEESSFVRTSTQPYRANNCSRSWSSEELTGVPSSEDSKGTSSRRPSIERRSSGKIPAKSKLFRGPLNLLANTRSKASGDPPRTSSIPRDSGASRASPDSQVLQPSQLLKSRDPYRFDQTPSSSKPPQSTPHNVSTDKSASVTKDSKSKLSFWSRVKSPVKLVAGTKIFKLKGSPQPVERPEPTRWPQPLYISSSQDALVVTDLRARDSKDEAKAPIPQSPTTPAYELRAALSNEHRQLTSDGALRTSEKLRGKDLRTDFEAVTPPSNGLASRGKLRGTGTPGKPPSAAVNVMPTLMKLCQLWEARNIDLRTRAQKYRGIQQEIATLGDEMRQVYYMSSTLGPPSVMHELEVASLFERSEPEEQQAAEYVLRQRDCIHARLSDQLTQSERLQLYAAWGVRRWSTGRLRRIVYKLLWCDPDRCDQSAALTAQVL